MRESRKCHPHVLFLVAVDGQRWPPILSQVLGDIIGHSLGADENEDLGVLGADLVEVLEEFSTLFIVRADLNVLLDVVVISQVH